MTDAPSPSLAEKTLSRLRGLAKGNGLAPEEIKILKANEATYEIEGRIDLTPSLKIENSTIFGRIKGGKEIETFSSFSAMKEEALRRKQEFERQGGWMKTALEELQKEPAHGWGIEEAEIAWPEKPVLLAATEACPACQGNGKTVCPHCHGLGTEMCIHCQGRGQELCPQCQGRCEDPLNPGQRCPVCNGIGHINCRFCQATGQALCQQCQGKKGIPCSSCKGTGYISQQAKLSKGARAHFSLGRTAGLPSGLLRMLDRIGLAKISNQIDVAMFPPAETPEKEADMTAVGLLAKIPFAEIRMSIAGEESTVYALGKNGRLSNVPLFLDRSLEKARKTLAQAAKGHGSLEKISGFRLIREAQSLVLSRKTSPNDLRRLYPVGLSGAAAQEIMKNSGLALKHFTSNARLVVSSAAVLLSAALFSGFFLFPPAASFLQTLSPQMLLALKIFLPAATLGGTWLALHSAARYALKRRYPKAKIAATQQIGRIGVSTLVFIAVLYGVFLLLPL